MAAGRWRMFRSINAKRGSGRALGIAAAVTCMLFGCSRDRYRQKADRDVYGILKQRTNDPRWSPPPRPVEPAPDSRLRDPSNPDKPPLPPDDQGASVVLAMTPCRAVRQRWPHRGELPAIEDFHWRGSLPIGPKGAVDLRRDNAMSLALLHSREYQTQVEQLYLTALSLTLQRFEYQVQWTGINRTFFDHFGSSGNESNDLSNNSNLGFRRNFATGGQLVVDFANSLVWEFSGNKQTLATSNLLVTLTQPLLRNAFSRIRVQELSLAEREVLYAIRTFTRFRRQFYVDTMSSGGGYLSLLLQTQGIRNIEANLESLERNLREHENLEAAGLVARIQVDQVFQQYQQGRLRLLTAQAALQTSLDNYKLQLGLPPDLEMHVDDSPLEAFTLNDAKLDELSRRNDEIYLALLQPDAAPAKPVLEDSFKKLLVEQDELLAALKKVDAEAQNWEDHRKKAKSGDARSSEAVREERYSKQIRTTLEEIRNDLVDDRKDAAKALATLDKTDSDTAWKQLRDLVGNEYRTRLADTFVTETQVRTMLIELTDLDLKESDGLDIALGNRLDLMNQQGRVTDAWRNVEVAADSLQAQLDLTYTADLHTDVDKNTLLRFDASNSRHRVGVLFDSPLNRLAQRNQYRASQIAYQQVRRAYMANEDQIRAQIRRDIRDLDLTKLQFDIARQQLVTAARQVEQAQFNLRTTRQADSSVTQDLLGALQSLLESKNSLISTWVGYETSRMNLYRDLDIMEIDPEGVWTNEREPPGQYGCKVELVNAVSDAGEVRPEPKPTPPAIPKEVFDPAKTR